MQRHIVSDTDSMLSLAFLGFMCLIFAYLGITIILDPDEELKGHGLSFVGMEPSAYAEIRAYYGGCFATLVFICARGVAASSGTRRKDALDVVCCLLFSFAAIRVYSYVRDGPPVRTNVYALWTAEAVGALVAGVLGFAELRRAAFDGLVVGAINPAVDKFNKLDAAKTK